MAFKVLDEYPFTFYGDTFSVALANDRKLYVPLYRLCDALEVDVNGQAQRIRRDEAITDALVRLTLEVPYGDKGTRRRQIQCLRLDRVPYWLGSLDATRIGDKGIRQKVIRFKREFADVAWAAFRSEIMPADVLAELDSTLPAREQEYHQAMDAATGLRGEVGEHGKRIKGVEDRVSALEARLVGTDFIHSAQAKQYLDMLAILADVLKKKGSGNHAIVHNRVKREFAVPSYQLIPEKDFPAVVKYLSGWFERSTPPGTPLPEPFRRPPQERLF